MRVNGILGRRLVISIGLLVATISPAFQAQPVSAAQITERSLTLSSGTVDSNGDGINDGGSLPGGVVNHQFDFTLPGGSNVGSIRFLYCTTASDPANPGDCVTPTGISTTGAGVVLGNETAVTGFTLNKTTNGSPYLTRTAAAVAANQIVSYRLDGITNPTATNTTFFVRISTFASEDTTGTPTDTGTVAASTANEIVLTGTMPESLIFCTGGTISTTSGIPDCSTATSGAITFNQLFSPSDTATASSQMAASTNALSGYAISVSGPTLTSGGNTIPAITTASTGVRGTGQFGMNLVANTLTTSDPIVGANIAPAANGPTNYNGRALTGYDLADTFQFVPGSTVADSAAGGTGAPTNSQIYTSSYIVNVSGAQPAGTYVTTLTYVCTPTF